MFDASNITVRFGGVVAVNDVSIAVEAGSTVGLVGPNGSGKTTFLNACTGVVRADGTVRVADAHVPLGAGRIRRAGLCRTFQTPQVFPELTVLENVLVGCADTGHGGFWAATIGRAHMSRRERGRRTQALEALEMVGLSGLAHEPAEDLAYGQARYVEIARAIAGEPGVLLMDEPSAGLNTEETSELAGLIEQASASGIAVLVVDHKIDYLKRVCDRIDVLQTGRLIASGEPEAVFSDPVVIDAYLGV